MLSGWFLFDLFASTETRGSRKYVHAFVGYGHTHHGAYAHDVMVTILVFQNNGTATIFMYKTNLVGVEPFSYVNTVFCCGNFA